VNLRNQTLLFVVLAACNDKGEDTALQACGDPCALSDDANFTYDSSMEVTVTQAQPSADLLLDWSALDTDVQGHAVDPDTGVTQVTLVVFKDLTTDEILDGLVHDQIDQTKVNAYFLCTPTGSTCLLSDFGLGSSKPGVDQYFLEDSGEWLFVLTGEDGGSRSLQFAEPSDASSSTDLVWDDQTASLSVDVDLHDSAAVGLPAGTTVTLDWSGLTRDGIGEALNLDKIDLLQVARYDLTTTELEEQFFDLKTLASETWSLDVGGVNSADLSQLEGDTAFPGIDANGTWMLALWCTTCRNPVPKVLARLEVADEP